MTSFEPTPVGGDTVAMPRSVASALVMLRCTVGLSVIGMVVLTVLAATGEGGGAGRALTVAAIGLVAIGALRAVILGVRARRTWAVTLLGVLIIVQVGVVMIGVAKGNSPTGVIGAALAALAFRQLRQPTSAPWFAGLP